MNTISHHIENSIKVLVIDDDDVDREKILRLLKKIPLSFQITEGSSAKDAVDYINHMQFDCAILDYQLKDALGSEIVSVMRQHNVRPLAIIMVSNNTDQQLVANVVRDGVFDYLSKQNLASDNLHKSLVNGLEWAQQEQKVREDLFRIEQLSQGLPQLVWSCDAEGNCDFINQKWLEYAGNHLTKSQGLDWASLMHADDYQDFILEWMTALKSGIAFFAKSRIKNNNDTYEWFDIRANPQPTNDGKTLRWLCSATNIHQLELAHLALANSENQFHACFDHSPVPMALITESGSIKQQNFSFQQLLGDPGNPDQKITSIQEIMSPELLRDHQHKISELIATNCPFIQYETGYVTLNGREVPVVVYAAVINQRENSTLLLLQVSDLTDQKNRERTLIRLAHFDTLTNLINRSKLHDEINLLVNRYDRHKIPFAILFGDLDNFKQINDGFGHEVGDYVLKIVARRLKRLLRQDDIIARLGGDEFVIILDGIDRYEIVAAIAEKLLHSLARPIRIASTQKVHISMSFGIALFPTDGQDSATLLRNADSALYEAKNNGRSQFQLYRRELTEFVHYRLQLDADLRKALISNQFELYFQPVVNLTTNKIIAAEALIRWNHPKRGMVLPGEFIPYSEESDMINRIGQWVIEEASRSMTLINQQQLTIPIAINLSARQFQQLDLIQQFKSALKTYQLSAEQFIIEITEQMFLERTELNLQQVSRLKETGFRISLDDFGVGYSSLSYIVRFAPDQIKIDRSFINQIGQAREYDGMVRTIIGLSKIMPMKIVAEGVETDKQKWFLIENGCDCAQGYFFYKPMPLEELLALLTQQTLH